MYLYNNKSVINIITMSKSDTCDHIIGFNGWWDLYGTIDGHFVFESLKGVGGFNSFPTSQNFKSISVKGGTNNIRFDNCLLCEGKL